MGLTFLPVLDLESGNSDRVESRFDTESLKARAQW